MGILRGSGFGEGWFSQDRREVKAVDDCGLAAAAALDGLMEDWPVVPCRRLQALGRSEGGAGDEMFQRMDAATSGQGSSSHQILIPAPEDGGPRGALPHPKTSTMIIRPPQQGHGGR